ncbi:ParA family protein [Leptospira meyeri]|nr:ParA family protein [Leptospira meyeri]
MRHKMIVFDFWNVKGGSGKSSNCYAAGLTLRDAGKKVLFIDQDPQRSITKTLNAHTNKSSTLFDVYMRQSKLQDSIIETEGFSICPGDLRLLRIQESVDQNRLAEELQTIAKKFDFVLIDNQPTWNAIVRAGIVACDLLIMPSRISIFDLDEVKFSYEEAKILRKNVPIKILLNQVSNAEKASKDEVEYIEMFLEKFKSDLLESRIPFSAFMKKIIDRGESLSGKDPSKTRLRTSLHSFISEITNNKVDLTQVA